MNKKKITVLGAGISGLAAAYWLHKDGFDIQILEAKHEAGGTMETFRENGFLIDFGPNSGLETTPLIRQLVGEVGLSDEMIYASDISSKRYILRDNKLYPLPMNPISLIKSKLFSAKGKFRLLGEPFVGKSDDGYYQSIAQFVSRRLGHEFLDYAIDPFISGVFAGDPHKLSVKSAFPKLYRLEELYGGLVKGMIKGARERKKRGEESKQSAKMFSFINGMQSFPKAIAQKLKDNISYECSVLSVELRTQNAEDKTGRWKIIYENGGRTHEIISDYVLSTVPVHAASKIFSSLDNNFTKHADNIFYPPVMVLYLGFNKKDIGVPLDGFGYLIPSKEKKNFLGAIWSSVIFPNRCDIDKAAFTLFIGGARSASVFENDLQELIVKVLQEFNQIMRIKADPIFLVEKLWPKAIPQYNIGYIEHDNYFSKFENDHPGLFLSGNYRGGISIGDCIKNSYEVYKKIIAN
jgi:oxygen-dependent protoporphyrinogen oxidase